MSCAGKEAFESFERAEQTARMIARRRKQKINAYRCRYCRGFHVGSTIRPKEGR
ncbi:MAG: hypothetical protein KGL39_59645 [Patescibacteria group bacterium]|nr:hypothetical protein [Patescibacteria group bacterium]